MQINSRVQLVDLMKHLDLPLIGAEVGVAEGRLSIELMRQGLKQLYLIDVWETVPFIEGCASFEPSWHKTNYDTVKENLAAEIERGDVLMLKGFSYKMAEHIPDNSLGLVYVDCDHTYQGCRADCDAYWPKLVKGGIMAFHDYKNPTYGVERAVWDFTKGEGIIELPEDGKLENIGAYIIKKIIDGNKQ